MRHRAIIPFRSVNRSDLPGYQAGLQRHHLIPRQVPAMRCFSRLVGVLGPQSALFDDFRRNGLLLPANDDVAVAMRLPLHRGPHRAYNALVLERFAAIEAQWSHARLHAGDEALHLALFRLELLQRALRRRLYAVQSPLTLNRRGAVPERPDYSVLDAMANSLWAATEPPSVPGQFQTSLRRQF